MMRLWGVLLLAGFLLPGGAALVRADDKKDEMAKFDGTWKLVSSEREGEKAPDDAIKTAKAVSKDGKVTLQVEGKTVGELEFVVDPTKKPKWLDATATSGPDKGKKTFGIYEFDGDMLKICFNEKERPKEFSAKKGSGNTLDMYKREKP
jgi:uncharacterized protein (TIGR03067 family)